MITSKAGILNQNSSFLINLIKATIFKYIMKAMFETQWIYFLFHDYYRCLLWLFIIMLSSSNVCYHSGILWERGSNISWKYMWMFSLYSRLKTVQITYFIPILYFGNFSENIKYVGNANSWYTFDFCIVLQWCQNLGMFQQFNLELSLTNKIHYVQFVCMWVSFYAFINK